MRKPFTKILVPVAFNRNTRWSVDKAVQLANKFECDVLLVHVLAPPFPFIFLQENLLPESWLTAYQEEAQQKMDDLLHKTKAKLQDGLLMTGVVLAGFWQKVIKDVVIAEQIDLVVVPRHRHRLNTALINRLNINKLSQHTDCPVLTVNRSFNANNLHNIVVPVSNFLPVRKLSIATYLSLATHGCIFLMGPIKTSAAKNDGCIGKAYQLLTRVNKLDIRCVVQQENESSLSTLSYARSIDANLIVVNTGKESKLQGWWNRIRGRYLSRESDIPILTVAASI